MCGIAGLVDIRDARPVDMARLERMTNAMIDRGPTSGGLWHENGIGFGHRRLAVLDLHHGQQPMLDATGRYVVTFNGMIYNHTALRSAYSQKGSVFQSQSSDTEVLLHAYHHHNDGMLYQLDGFFAFVLWDRSNHSLLMARDVVGKKPLYYTIDAYGWLVFASTLAALLKGLDYTPALRYDAVEDYFTLGYVPDPKTIYQNIFKLAPGHAFSWQRGQTWKSSTCYQRWHFSTQTHTPNAQSAVRELEFLLENAVKKRLIADVPLGSFLSGGIDSGTITALAAKYTSTPLRTMTACFDVRALDESIAAQETAQHINNIFPQQLNITTSDVLPFDASVALTTEPFADASLVPSALLCHAAAKYVTTVLSGDGGDELFAGYARYPFFQQTEKLKQFIPWTLRNYVGGLLASVWPRWQQLPRWARLQSTFSVLSQEAPAAYLRTMAMVPDVDRLPLYQPSFLKKLDGYRTVELFKQLWKQLPLDGQSPLDAARTVDLHTWLSGRMLVKIDRAAGACGLEIRNPLLDKTIIEYALHLPTNLLLHQGIGKHVLRLASHSVLPRRVAERPKQGLVYPAADYFMHGQGASALSILRQQNAPLYQNEIIQHAAVNKIIDDYTHGRHTWFRPLWVLLTFNAFMRQQ